MNELVTTDGLRTLLSRTLSGERLAEKDLTGLNFEERLWLIQRSPVRAKANLIISSPDPVKLLKKLSPQEIYLTVKESWGDDAAVILEMTPPDKIVHLMDMDIWRRDRIDFHKFMEWLQLLSEGGERTLTKTLFSLDEPLVVLFFKGIIEVTSRNLDQDPLELSDDGWYSFDNLYYFKPIIEEINFDLIANLLMQFFEFDPGYYQVIMEGVSGDLPSPMEEEAYQTRSSRMSMIGFPELYEARELFHFEDPEKIAREIRSETAKVIYLDDRQANELPPHYWLIPTGGKGFFEDLMGEAANERETAHLFWEFSYLVHKIMAASGSDFSEVGELISSARTAGDYINLGLEYLAGDKRQEGNRIIREVYLVRLFRLGYMSVLAPRKVNEALIGELGKIINPSLWGNLPRGVVAGLLEKPPLFFTGLTGDGDGYRNFRSPSDLYAVADFLVGFSARVRLISTMIDIPDDIKPWLIENARLSDWGLEHLFMTACVRASLDGRWQVVPLSGDDIGRFYDIVKTTPGFIEGIIEKAEAFIRSDNRIREEQDTIAALQFVRDTCTDFVTELTMISDRDDIDERFISGVITYPTP